MAHSLLSFFLLFVVAPTSFSSFISQTYIVHVSPSHRPSHFQSSPRWYRSILRSLPPSTPPPVLLYSYTSSMHGFSTSLTDDQAAALERQSGVLSVLPDNVRHPHTTLTPTFLNLSLTSGIWQSSNAGEGVIIGVLDTGIWPERQSFSIDDGMPTVPSSWKGGCENASDFPASSCNKKLIGARAFSKGYLAYLRSQGLEFNSSKETLSPRDTEGHGTHTASTAAGSAVSNASLYGYATGVATGMAPKAHVAAYKICWTGCLESDILAAMDMAIQDGVHVISLSVGSSGKQPQYDRDSIAIGAFGATMNGVIVSCSAGNSGPGSRTVGNTAPWLITVGASTINREFPANIVLGDGKVFPGASLYAGDPLPDSLTPLIYGGDAGDRFCTAGKLNQDKVKGKLVICDRGGNSRVEKGYAVKLAGGLGMVLSNLAANGRELVADAHILPAALVGNISGSAIKEYAKLAESPNATIVFSGTVIGTVPTSPRVAAFSSRGPNSLVEEILKPDVIAPGVNILAAWTGFAPPSGLDSDTRMSEFNIVSGTSMSCPHVSGLAALLRRAQPKWSPAAIRSALVTTAYGVDNSGAVFRDLSSGGSSTPFAHGAGHVDPNRALDPGLVYDLGVNDYVKFLCAIGYTAQRISTFTRNTTASDVCDGVSGGLAEFNYPSFSVVFDLSRNATKQKRAVTNVGSDVNAVYEVKIVSPTGVGVTISPSRLEFSDQNRTLSYEVVFSSVSAGDGSPRFGTIEWSNGNQVVRSPFAVQWRKQSSLASL